MTKEHKEQLFPLIEQQLINLIPGLRYIELGPEWDYYISEGDNINYVGKFQLLYTNGECKSFVAYEIKDEKASLIEVTVCQITAAIDEVADLSDAHYQDDVSADIIFVPYGGYWVRIHDRNEFWPLIPNVEIKAYNYEDFRNKVAEISLNNNI